MRNKLKDSLLKNPSILHWIICMNTVLYKKILLKQVQTI